MPLIGILNPPVVTTGLPEDPVDGTYRVNTDGNGSFLQLKDADTGMYRSIFLKGGAIALGPEEE